MSKQERVYEHGPGFARAKECPDCGHTLCGESCVCNCDAAHAEHEVGLLRQQLRSEPPWLSDAAEALGEVRPGDGAPRALNWNQVLEAIRDMRDERDEWKLRAEQSMYHHECCLKRSHTGRE